MVRRCVSGLSSRTPRAGGAARRGALAAGVLWLAACASVPENNYFTMDYNLLPVPAGVSSHPVSVRVQDLGVTPAYDKDQIVYRYSPYQFQYYNYMLWAVKPQKMVTELLVRHLEHSRLFDSVVREYGEASPDFELSGVLQSIEELDSGNEWFAHLAFQVRLTRRADERVVWSYRVDAKKQVFNKAPVYVVKALSELMEAETERLVADLHKYLDSRPQLREEQP